MKKNKVENVYTYNFLNAIRGMRNPLESWDKMDSVNENYEFRLGPNDQELALKLIKAGSDHSKFMRQIFISMDITAPLYWWKEMDTYKVSTVVNSTSTMHKLGHRLLTERDFQWDKITKYREGVIFHLNQLIQEWRKTKSEAIFREMIQDLPDSYLQTRTWTGNYSNLRNMYHSRKNHKQYEWREFCNLLEELPCGEFIIVESK